MNKYGMAVALVLILGVIKIQTGLADPVRHHEDTIRHRSGKVAKKEWYGDWKVVGYRWGDSTIRDEQQAHAQIGATLSFAPKHAMLMGEVCRSPKYTLVRRVNSAVVLLLYGMSCSIGCNDMGIKRSLIDIVDIKCADRPNELGSGITALMLLMGKDQMAYLAEGPLFYLQRIKKADTVSANIRQTQPGF